jgi:ectoine hydroxylase-related dioxygenase (phytanoyl-CoA dioxygenase family)
MASPLTQQSVVCQSTYWLTDFNRKNGGTAIVPGSHKWCRRPTDTEAALLPYEEGGKDQAVVINAPPGSLVCWHGNTWHGAFNRIAPGLRVSMTVYFVRQFMRPLEDYIGRVPQKLLDRHGPRFAMALQQGCVPGATTQSSRVANTASAEKVRSAYEQEVGVDLGSKGDHYA